MRFFIPFLMPFIFLSFLACEENQEFIEEKAITIDEVKNFVNDQVQGNGREEQAIRILYDLGVYRESSLGDAIFFPVDPWKELYVSGSDSTRRFSVASTSFTYAYKNDGELFVDLIQPVPTTNQAVFTGYVLVSRFGGQVKRVLYYEDGVFVGEKNDGRSNGRGEGVDCETTHYYGCWDVSVGGDSYGGDCEYEGSSTTCNINNDDNTGGIQPDEIIDLNPGGGGEGGASPSEQNNCVNPFNPDLRVPCNDNTCGEGFVSDGNGGCVVVEFDLDLDQNPYKGLNDCEKKFKDENDYKTLYKLFSNRELANAKAIELFSYTHNYMGTNDCADAFRHAFFSALNVRDVGLDKARQLGNAHECDTPDNLSLEKEMDLFNNEIGFQIGLEYGADASNASLAIAVWASLENGSLKYLSNINYNDPCFVLNKDCSLVTHGITSQSSLISTNRGCL